MERETKAVALETAWQAGITEFGSACSMADIQPRLISVVVGYGFAEGGSGAVGRDPESRRKGNASFPLKAAPVVTKESPRVF